MAAAAAATSAATSVTEAATLQRVRCRTAATSDSCSRIATGLSHVLQRLQGMQARLQEQQLQLKESQVRAPLLRALELPCLHRSHTHPPARTSHPTSRRFFLWHAAAWAVAVAFCAAVCAHTLQLLPPAPYLILLLLVIARQKVRASSAAIPTLAQAMAAVVALLASPSVRSLTRQANNALRSFDMCSLVCACVLPIVVNFTCALMAAVAIVRKS